MKKIIAAFLFLFILAGCSPGKYLLTDRGKDKKYLTEYINTLVVQNKISKHPLIVIDGKPFRYDVELENAGLPLSKDDIGEIRLLEQRHGEALYGEFAKGGTILIITKTYQRNNPKKPGENGR